MSRKDKVPDDDEVSEFLFEGECPVILTWEPPKCECGQVNVPYAKHSSYCPLYKREDE